MINFEFDLDEGQAVFVREIMNPDKTIVFCNSCAGTGKTTLSMGAANILVQDKRNKYDGIVYIVSPYGEERQGYADYDLYRQRWTTGLFLGVKDKITHWMPLPEPPKEADNA